MIIDNDELLVSVCVRGEISNFTNHYKTGHFYMTLKDEASLIKAVMFRGNASKLKFLPENGMKVIVTGRVSAYIRDGQYQIYIDSMEPDGIGALYIAYEQLKKKLGRAFRQGKEKASSENTYPNRNNNISHGRGDTRYNKHSGQAFSALPTDTLSVSCSGRRSERTDHCRNRLF